MNTILNLLMNFLCFPFCQGYNARERSALHSELDAEHFHIAELSGVKGADVNIKNGI